MIKALFFDIDGTLVSFRTHEIPESTLEALAQAHAKGIRIFISTGRARILINNLGALTALNLIDGYITMNGAYCFVGDEVLHKAAIPAHDVKLLTDYCARRNVPCIVVGENDICVCQPTELVHRIFFEHLKVTTPLPERSPREATEGKEIFQLTPFIDESEEADIMPSLNGSEVGRWHPAFADVTALNNTKQFGMDVIMQRFGLKREETMAFGDGGNDISMLRHAGIGVAMGNADNRVQSAADYVTSSVDDNGVAHALQHFGII